jgi:PAS domain S-box-containing protein
MTAFNSYKTIFDASPAPELILLPDEPVFTILEVNSAYCKATGTHKSDLLGKGFFEAFPPNAKAPQPGNSAYTTSFLKRVLETKGLIKTGVQQFDIPVRETGEFQVRYWSAIYSPVLNEKEEILFIIHSPTDLTDQFLAEQNEKIANERLVINQEHYSSLFNNNPDAVFSVSLEGKFLSANDKLASMAECTLQELMTITFVPFLAPEDKERVHTHFEKAGVGEIQNYNTGMITAKGRRLLVNVTNIPITVNQKIVGIYGIAKDITKSMQAGEDLKRSREELLKIMDSSVDVICIIDEAKRFVKVSKASYNTWGYFPIELEGKSYMDLIYGKNPDTINETASWMKNNKTLTDWKNQYKRKDGKIVTMSWTAYWDDVEKLAYCVGRDITEQVKAEEQIRKNEKIRTLIMDSALDAIICFSPGGKITLWNIQAEKMFGYQKENMMGKDITDHLMPGRYHQQLRAALKQYEETGKSSLLNRIIEVMASRRGQQEFPIELIVVPVEESGTLFFCAFIRDITQRREHLTAIEEQNEKLRKIAWIQSHVVRAPLCRIMGLVDLLNNYPVENTSELLKALLTSAEELDSVIKDIVKKTGEIDLS